MKYRIKNKNKEGYIIQERCWLIFPVWYWYTYTEPFTRFDKVFITIEEAKKYLKQEIEKEKKYKEEVKKMKYTEYL